MHKKSIKQMICLYLISMLLVQMAFTNTAFAAASYIQRDRLSGSDRIETAIQISKAGWSTSDYAVLVTADDYPDALCAAPLAKKYNAPLLLTDGKRLNDNVKAELGRLNVRNVIIVGGAGVVSEAVFYSVREIASTERIAGSDREETSLEVAKKLGNVNEAVLATGSNFPDALSISSIAASKGMPILLLGTNTLSQKTAQYLTNYGVQKTYIVGGTGVISSTIESRVPSPKRLAGTDRVETNYQIINEFSDSFDFSNIYIATANNFPDALAGSALAAKTSSPIVLAVDSILLSTKSFLKDKMRESSRVRVLGGAGAVPDFLIDNLITFINGNAVTPGVLGVQSISTVGLNQIKVVFSQAVDKYSAETAGNYILNGVNLTSSDRLMLDSDKKTLNIILDNAMIQNRQVSLTIKENAVLSEDTISAVPLFITGLVFFDVTRPSIKSAATTDSKTLIVEFTEPVKMPSALTSSMDTLFKIDGQYLLNYGFFSANAVNPTTVGQYSTKIEIDFNVSLPSGSHVLTVPDGDAFQLVDAAGLTTVITSIGFTTANVDSPKVISVTGENNGTVYVTFDRPMDSTTAEGQLLYKINEIPAISAAFKTGTDNKVVRLVFGPRMVVKGANVLVLDKGIKDTNGSSLDDEYDIRHGFFASEDTVKPTVTSVTLIDNRHLRVIFSEVVDSRFAANSENYTIKDSSGKLLDNISSIYSASSATYSDNYTISLDEDLTGSKYTIKINNIPDLAESQNIMNEYTTTLTFDDSSAPTVVEEILPSGSTSQVVIYFSEAMDRGKLLIKQNYSYKDGDDNYHDLPSAASVQAGEDNKSAVINFPASYKVKTSGWAGEYNIKGVRVVNVTDISGNVLDGIVGYEDVIDYNSAESKPSLVEDSFKLYTKNDAICAEFEFDQTLSLFYITDFRVAGVTPDSGFTSGKKITLNFVNSDKINIIKYAGTYAELSTVATSSANIHGIRIPSFSSIKAHYEQIAPKLLSVSASNSAGNDTILVRFSEEIDDSISGTYKDDFNFIANGSLLSVKDVDVTSDTVVYYFNSNSFNIGSSIMVKAISGKNSIRDMEDESGNQNLYVPSASDLGGIYTTAQ